MQLRRHIRPVEGELRPALRQRPDRGLQLLVFRRQQLRPDTGDAVQSDVGIRQCCGIVVFIDGGQIGGLCEEAALFRTLREGGQLFGEVIPQHRPCLRGSLRHIGKEVIVHHFIAIAQRNTEIEQKAERHEHPQHGQGEQFFQLIPQKVHDLFPPARRTHRGTCPPNWASRAYRLPALSHRRYEAPSHALTDAR